MQLLIFRKIFEEYDSFLIGMGLALVLVKCDLWFGSWMAKKMNKPIKKRHAVSYFLVKLVDSQNYNNNIEIIFV